MFKNFDYFVIMYLIEIIYYQTFMIHFSKFLSFIKIIKTLYWSHC